MTFFVACVVFVYRFVYVERLKNHKIVKYPKELKDNKNRGVFKCWMFGVGGLGLWVAELWIQRWWLVGLWVAEIGI